MKKAIALALCIALCATALVSGTIAFLTDEERADNVFEVGNVNIEQYEQDRDGNPFNPEQNIFPIVKPSDPDSVNPYTDYIDGSGIQLRNPDYDINYLDKIVTVKNTGKNEAYVRNIVAIPTGLPAGAADVPWLVYDFLDASGNDNDDWTKLSDIVRDVEIDGTLYDLHVFNYNGPDNGLLQSGDDTLPTLLGFGLSSNVDFEENLTENADNEYVDEDGNVVPKVILDEQGKVIGAYYYSDPETGERTYLTITTLMDNHIYVASQAVQAEGFEDIDHAFTNGFKGAITATNHPWYKAPVEPIMGYVGNQPYTWAELTTGTEPLVKIRAINGLNYLSYIAPSVTELKITSDNVDVVDAGNAMYSYERDAATLKKVTIGDGVKLYSLAFMNFPELTEVYLSGGVTFTDNSYSHFSGCKKLESAIIGEGMTLIPKDCFRYCQNLSEVKLPSTIEIIGDDAFYDCESLAEIKLPKSFAEKTDEELKAIFEGALVYTSDPQGFTYYS